MFSLIHASARLTSTMWSGQVCLRADAVVDRHADPAALGHVAQQRIRLRPPHADGPCAARHLQQHRRLAVAGQIGAPPDVGEVDPRCGPYLDGAGLLDVAATDQRRWANTPSPAARDRLRLRGDQLVVLAERLAQRVLEMRLRRDVAALDQPQQTPCDRGEQQRDSAARARGSRRADRGAPRRASTRPDTAATSPTSASRTRRPEW